MQEYVVYKLNDTTVVDTSGGLYIPLNDSILSKNTSYTNFYLYSDHGKNYFYMMPTFEACYSMGIDQVDISKNAWRSTTTPFGIDTTLKNRLMKEFKNPNLSIPIDDSTYVFSTNKEVYIVRGNNVKSFDIKDLLDSKRLYLSSNTADLMATPIAIYNNIYWPLDRKSNMYKFSDSLHVLATSLTGEASILSFKVPTIVTDGFYGYITSSTLITKNDSGFVLSLAYSKQCISYNLYTTQVRYITLKSGLEQEDDIFPLDRPKKGKKHTQKFSEAENIHSLQTGYYSKFVYDDKSKMYFRVYCDSLTLDKGNGMFRTRDDKKQYIAAFDANFNYLYDIYVGDQLMGFDELYYNDGYLYYPQTRSFKNIEHCFYFKKLKISKKIK